MRKKTSVIWMLPTDELRELVNNSKTMSEVLGFFGLRNRGSNYRTMTQRLRQEGIDWSKFKENWGHGQIKPLRPLEEILVEHSTYTNSSCLKRRLIKEGVLENKCVLCGLGPIWNGKPLSLTLDHENGTSDDNRRENLRILCPNCHSQTPTFAGKRHKKTKPLADRHRPRLSRRKVIRPSFEILTEEIKMLGYSGTGRKYGVSGNSVRKWMRSYGGLV